jgi:hypothetical protein
VKGRALYVSEQRQGFGRTSQSWESRIPDGPQRARDHSFLIAGAHEFARAAGFTQIAIIVLARVDRNLPTPVFRDGPIHTARVIEMTMRVNDAEDWRVAHLTIRHKRRFRAGDFPSRTKGEMPSSVTTKTPLSMP